MPVVKEQDYLGGASTGLPHHVVEAIKADHSNSVRQCMSEQEVVDAILVLADSILDLLKYVPFK